MAIDVRQSCNILKLPIEIQIKILLGLGFHSQEIARKVCTLWADLILNTPAIRARRYISYISSDNYYYPKAARLHKIFNDRGDRDRFRVIVDLAAGRVTNWLLSNHYDSDFCSEQYEGDKENSDSEPSYDLSDSPFLDEPVFDWSEPDIGSSGVIMGRGNQLETGKLSECDGPRKGGPDRLKLEIHLSIGTEINEMDWGESLAAFIPGHASRARVSNRSSVNLEKKIAESLTVRKLIEAFVARFTVEINKGNIGYYQTKFDSVENPTGTCCRCHFDSPHWPPWKGSRDVIFSFEITDCESDDDRNSQWAILVSIYNPREEEGDEWEASENESAEEEEHISDEEEARISDKEDEGNLEKTLPRIHERNVSRKLFFP